MAEWNKYELVEFFGVLPDEDEDKTYLYLYENHRSLNKTIVNLLEVNYYSSQTQNLQDLSRIQKAGGGGL